jgi:hydroxyacylglutathione hydrolase
MIKILPILAFKDNYIWCLINEQTKHCIIVDPGEAKPVLTQLKQLNLTLDAILITHHHWDHVTGVPELAKLTGAPVWCSAVDRERITGATVVVSGLERLWDLEVEILTVPGHTQGQIAYYFPRLEALFPGDTLFSAGCGRLFEGTPDQMFASMRKLAALPPETKVYFGHEYTLNNLDFVAKYEAAFRPVVETSGTVRCSTLPAERPCPAPPSRWGSPRRTATRRSRRGRSPVAC